ncbi:MAG: hypothetical protein WCV90_00535 [Candidatus Woesearchaeota archaeon]|jgi:hypothetical protein
MTEEILEKKVLKTEVSRPVTTILTYRGVDDFFPGVYGIKGGRELLIAKDLREKGDHFPRKFSYGLLERVDQAFVYYGALSDFGETQEVELERHLQYYLGEDYQTRGIKIALVSCGCCVTERKMEAAKSLGLPFLAGLSTDSQATKTMGEIAKAVLGGESYESIVDRFRYSYAKIADYQI